MFEVDYKNNCLLDKQNKPQYLFCVKTWNPLTQSYPEEGRLVLAEDCCSAKQQADLGLPASIRLDIDLMTQVHEYSTAIRVNFLVQGYGEILF